MDPSRLWGYAQVAEAAGITVSQVRTLRRQGRAPEPAARVKGRPLWNPVVVQRWVKARNIEANTWSRADIERSLRRTWASLKQAPSWPDFPRPVRGRWDRKAVLAWWRAHLSRADGRWDSQDIVTHTGLSWESVRTYRRRGILPEPDGVDTNRPWWWPDTIRAWDVQRRKAVGGRRRQQRPHVRKRP